jgi:serine/threonine-protein kinase
MPDSPEAARAPELPQKLGRYEVVESIGRGAMGRVLLARDPVLDRDVAIKFLRQDLKLTEDERETLLRRMRQEARASARVSHPNIVALFDMGEEPEIGVYLVFEHAEGITLKSRLTRGPLAPKAAAQLATELGDALTTAHRAGVLHRDVKPENIILTKTGAKIADFGIARVPESTLTKGGGLLGTPAYSAPESITYGEHSAQSDQFSLAATLYEATSGRRAFPGDDAVGVATRIQTEEPPPVARSLGLAPVVDAVLSRGLCKTADKRFSSCAELGQALANALDPREIEMRPSQVTMPDAHHRALAAARLSPGSRLRVGLGGLLLGAVLTLLVVRVVGEMRTSEPPVASGEVTSPLPNPYLPDGTARTPSPPLTAAPPRSGTASAPKRAASAAKATPSAAVPASPEEAPSPAAPSASVVPSAPPSEGQ